MAAVFPASFSSNGIHWKGGVEDGRERNVLQKVEIFREKMRDEKIPGPGEVRSYNRIPKNWGSFGFCELSILSVSKGWDRLWKDPSDGNPVSQVSLPAPLPDICHQTGCSAFLPSETIFLLSDSESLRRRHSLASEGVKDIKGCYFRNW